MESHKDVQARSAGLRKELGLRDLVLTQVLFVVGSMWVGTAAKLGSSHTVFWLLALLLFYFPQALVVIYLNQAMPLEGGLYQWAKLGLNEFAGFLVGWNLWLYIILFISSMGVMLATNLAYAFGPRAAWLASDKWAIAVVTCALTCGLVLVAALGLGVGKWVQNLGGVMQLVTFGALLAMPLLALGRGVAWRPLEITLPAMTLLNLNIFGKMSMGALSGFEYVAILAGECRDPVRTIGRSVMIAAPVIALMFILGTDSVLAFVPPQGVDLVGPIPQVLSLGFAKLGVAGPVGAVVILLLVGRQVGAGTLAIAGGSRLPMVAGWDHLLPAWFSRLHPKYKTPVNSILFVGALILTMGLAGLIGVENQEAFQLLDNASGIFYGIAYLVMFAVPLVGLRFVAKRPPWWLRIAAGSGFAVTLLYVVLSVFPIITVTSWLSFALKVGGVVAGANVVGAGLFWFYPRKEQA